MEHKRDTDAAGLIWPRAMARSSQGTARSPDASSSAAPLNPPESATTPATTTLASSSSAPENPVTNLGMYSATPGTQPPAPFPTSGHHHITSPHHGRFNERLVHQIYFKIFNYLFQQHSGTFDHGDPGDGLLTDERPRTLLLHHDWRLGLVPAYGGLLASLPRCTHSSWRQSVR